MIKALSVLVVGGLSAALSWMIAVFGLGIAAMSSQGSGGVGAVSAGLGELVAELGILIVPFVVVALVRRASRQFPSKVVARLSGMYYLVVALSVVAVIALVMQGQIPRAGLVVAIWMIVQAVAALASSAALAYSISKK